MKENNKKIIVYALIGIVVLLLLLLTLFPGMIYAIKDLGVVGNNIENKCIPANGYTEQEWREHMSHHPNIYKECLL